MTIIPLPTLASSVCPSRQRPRLPITESVASICRADETITPALLASLLNMNAKSRRINNWEMATLRRFELSVSTVFRCPVAAMSSSAKHSLERGFDR